MRRGRTGQPICHRLPVEQTAPPAPVHDQVVCVRVCVYVCESVMAHFWEGSEISFCNDPPPANSLRHPARHPTIPISHARVPRRRQTSLQPLLQPLGAEAPSSRGRCSRSLNRVRVVAGREGLQTLWQDVERLGRGGSKAKCLEASYRTHNNHNTHTHN